MTPEKHPLRHHALVGIGLMVAAITCLSTVDACAKWLGGAGYAVPEILFVRSLIGLIPVCLFIMRQGGVRALRTQRPFAHLMRLMFLFCGASAFFWALPRMPLAEAATITFSIPLFVTIIAVLFLREKVGWHRWTAIAVGFLGVLVVLRPGIAVFQPASLAALLAALCYGSMMISARVLSTTETAESLIFWPNVGMIPVAGAFLFWGWIPPDSLGWLVFALAGVIGGVGQILLVLAFRHAEGSTIAPFQYVSLLTATLYGWLVWDTLPDVWTLVGAAIVVGAGIYIIRREKKTQRHLIA